MIMRITENIEGIEHYFESGQKKGRQKSREEIDKRVYLSGDLDAFSDAVKHTNKAKKWKNNYWHITGSFALNDQDISDEKIKSIHQDILKYYFCRYDIDKIIHASEIHRPKIQTNAIGGQRFAHFHMAISKWDQETDNQLRQLPYKHGAAKAFQSYLALKYGLEDPANNEREKRPGPDELAAMQGKPLDPDRPKKITLPDYKKKLIRLLAEVTSIKDAKAILEAQEDITEVADPKPLASGNKYFRIKSSLFPKIQNINLQGQGFEELEELYYTPKETAERIMQGKYKPLPAPKPWGDYKGWDRVAAAEVQRAIFEKHQKWWTGKALEPKNKSKPKAPPKKIDYSKFENDYAPKFEKRIKEQRVYFVIYRFNIQVEQIQGYRIWEKNNIRYLINNDAGVKIYDRPDKITLSIPDDPEKRKKAIELALTVAQAKGWDLRTIKITGSDVFVKETKKQIAALIKSGKLDKVKPAVPVKVPSKPKPYLNAVGQQQADLAEKKMVNLLSKDRIKAIKTDLDPQSVIDMAVEKWGLPVDYYIALDDNKIGDKRIKKKKNIIDFLAKVCHQPISEVFPLLDDLLRTQEVEEQAKEQAQYDDLQTSSVDPEAPQEEPEIEEDNQDLDDDYGFRM